MVSDERRFTPSPGTPGEGRGEGSPPTTKSPSPNPTPTDKIGYLLARLRHIAQDEGFAVNEKKTRVLRQAARQSVTGVVVNARPGVSRDLARRMRAILHRAKTEGLAKQNRENHPHFEAWVRGMVSYISMVNPQQGGPLRQALAALGG